MSSQVVLLSRPGCGLCRKALEILEAERERIPFDLEEIDVSADDALEKEYGIRIPVVLIDGEEVFELEIDRKHLRRLLAIEGSVSPSEP